MTILFKNCSLLDLKNSQLQEGYYVLIENDCIKEVSDRPIKTSVATTFDLKGKVLMPGLIDAHVHVNLVTIDIGKINNVAKSYVTARAAKLLESMLMRGFTTVRDAGGADYGLVNAITENYINGPRLFISGRAISQTGGHGDFRPRTLPCSCNATGDFSVIADGISEVRKAAREELRQGANQIKIMASGGIASPNDPISTIQYSKDEIRAIVEEATAWHTYVMAHAYTPQAIQHAIECGVRSIEHGNLIDANTAALVAEKKAYIVPTLVTYEMMAQFGEQLGAPKECIVKLADVKEAGLRSLEICKQAGVKIGHGSDLLGDLQIYQSQEFAIKSQVLTTAECIDAATATNAELLNMSNKLGIIAPGAFADLLVVNGNPMKNLDLLQGQGENLVAIMKGGVFYKNQLANVKNEVCSID